ncbi:MAG TPA: response regulator [Herpetosiphonaceae bacterium]|nr:response regulator [Herpetosiphonaceae bacterium]
MNTIVVVDDTPEVALLMAKIFHRRGYEVRMLEDGLNLIETMRAELPSLVLLDVSLPYKDGWSLVAEIRGTPEIKHIPVIAFSALVTPDERKRMLAAGYTDCIGKPFVLTDVLVMVEHYMPKVP